MALVAIVIVRAGVVIRDETIIARAEQRLNVEADLASRAALPASETTSSGRPPRASMADASFRARLAATADSPTTGADLDRAAADIAAATRARPHWGDAWTVRAFVESLRSGRDSPATRAALARSYADAPFLRLAGPWRVRFGLERWPVLDARARQHVIREAAWLARIDRAAREPVFALARQSPAYATFLLHWRAMRAGDADAVRRERAAP